MKGITRLERRLLSQYLLVFVAFLLMVVISGYYAGDIVTKHLSTYGAEAITASTETLQTYLEGHQATFEDVAYVIEDMYSSGANTVEITRELEKWNTRLHGNDARYRDFLFIYGVVDDTFVKGDDWIIPEGYDPASRPWYTGAFTQHGQTYYCDPYPDAQTGEWIMSLSRVLYDERGDSFGVLAFDVYLSTITDYVNSMHLMNHGYGALADSEMRFIVHPNPSVFGVVMDELERDKAVAMRANDELDAYNFTNLAGVNSVMFSRKLFNDWYLYVAAPYADYYHDVNTMFVVLSVAGLVSTLILCGVLTIMHRARAQSDEATRINASLLESANAQAAAVSLAHARAKTILDATPFGCKIWDKDFHVIDCNQEIVRLFGLANEQEYIDHYFDLLPERQPDGTLSSEKAVFFVQRAFEEGRQVFEWMYRLPDGSPMPSEVTLVRVNYGEDIAVAGYIRDLREYKQMMVEIANQNKLIDVEKRLNEELAHWYKSILDATPFLITVTDVEMNWAFVNKAVEDFLGTKFEDMLGQPCSNWNASICNTDDCGIACAKRGQRRTYFKQNDRSYQVDVEILKDLSGDVSGYIEVVDDVTSLQEAREKLEIALNEAQNASKAKTDFLASMSHEIRTPMNAIIGMTELLMRSKNLSAHDTDCLNDINVSAHSLLHIINDILDMSKIESGKMELNPIHYDFQALLDNISSMFTYVSNKKGLDFITETSGAIPEALYGDDIRIRQVLTNICGNAVKFTEKGSITLRVAIPEDAASMTMEIRDTGMGIRKEDIPRLFSAFEQSKTEENRYVAGTGLGLVISKSFIEMMGGSITLDSEYGVGTVFTITIPLVAGDPSQVKHDSDVLDLVICAPQARILVVDDNDYNLKVAHGLLELFEIDAETASSGKEAIQMVMDNDYDIVFMDHMMPEMDGLETTAAIRALGEKYSKQNIIALTANAVQGAKEMFLENGFNGFLSKPIELTELTKTLMEWLPAELIIRKEKDDEATDGDDGAYRDFFAALAEVEGLDPEIGLRHFNGLQGMYHDSLKLFFEKLAFDSDRLDAQLRGQDYGNFSISVHAIKSTLAGVGANEMSDAAFRLEMASKNNETEYCETHFPDLLDSLRTLHKQLSAVFPSDEDAGEKEKGDEAQLREALPRAVAAVEAYDNDGAIEVLDGLLAFDFGEETGALLSEAVAALKRYEFDEAKEIIAKI